MKTTITIYRPGAVAETRDVELGGQPGNRELREILSPLLDGALYEHVSVLHDDRRADMFVDEDGHGKGLERNEAATAIYRANMLHHHPRMDPESLPWIAGTAILFSRRVWF